MQRKEVDLEELLKDQESFQEIDVETLKHVAYVVGNSGAATAALREADSHDGPVKFFLNKKSNSLLVQKLPKNYEEESETP